MMMMNARAPTPAQMMTVRGNDDDVDDAGSSGSLLGDVCSPMLVGLMIPTTISIYI